MIPTIDSMKTVGLVQKRGNDDRLIIGGATGRGCKIPDSVLFMLITAVSLTAMTVGFSRIASSSPRGISWFFSKKMSAALDRVNAKSARVLDNAYSQIRHLASEQNFAYYGSIFAILRLAPKPLSPTPPQLSWAGQPTYAASMPRMSVFRHPGDMSRFGLRKTSLGM